MTSGKTFIGQPSIPKFHPRLYGIVYDISPQQSLILSNYASRYPKVLILLHVKFFGPFPVGAFLHYLFDLLNV